MGIVLYRAGITHIVKGIECEYKVFDPFEFEAALNIGEWMMSPEEVANDPEYIDKKQGLARDKIYTTINQSLSVDPLDVYELENMIESLNKLNTMELFDLEETEKINNTIHETILNIEQILSIHEEVELSTEKQVNHLWKTSMDEISLRVNNL